MKRSARWSWELMIKWTVKSPKGDDHRQSDNQSQRVYFVHKDIKLAVLLKALLLSQYIREKK